MIEKSCPITNQLANENTARTCAFLTLLIMLIFIFTNNILCVLFLLIDFSIRGFIKPKYSIIFNLSNKIIETLNLSPKMINAGPKIFAAKIGVIFTTIILISFAVNLVFLTLFISIILSVCAFMEALFSICIACKLYTFLPTKE